MFTALKKWQDWFWYSPTASGVDNGNGSETKGLPLCDCDRVPASVQECQTSFRPGPGARSHFWCTRPWAFVEPNLRPRQPTWRTFQIHIYIYVGLYGPYIYISLSLSPFFGVRGRGKGEPEAPGWGGGPFSFKIPGGVVLPGEGGGRGAGTVSAPNWGGAVSGPKFPPSQIR